MNTLPKDDPIITVGQVFTPASPVEMKQLFAGRAVQLNKINAIIAQKGQHPIIFGDRGVGKTSFANIVKILTESRKNQVVKVQCLSEDTFESLWQKILEKFSLKIEKVKDDNIGFNVPAEIKAGTITLLDYLGKEKPNSHNILKLLEVLGSTIEQGIIIIDEFDRLDDKLFNKRLFADLIKAISDNLPFFKIILVAVAENVSSLIAGHESIERNLGQVYMPVMNQTEIKEIITNGASRLHLTFTPEVIDNIVQLSAGYPHFTHFLCYHAASLALQNKETEVDDRYLGYAISETTDASQESLRDAFMRATWTSKKRTIFKEVLYAAAMVETDSHGYFQASDLTKILSKELNKKVNVGHFVSHLKKFCAADRAEILKVSGLPNRAKYKFRNPLMKAFIVINKLKEERCQAGKEPIRA